MTSCTVCGGEVIENKALDESRLFDLGIPVKVSKGAAIEHCASCGHEAVVIQNMKGLVEAGAFALAFVPYKLNSSEITFCRKAMGLTGKALSKILEVKPETVSRWENDKQPITDALEKLLRMNVALSLRELVQGMPGFSIDDIVKLRLSPVRALCDIPELVFGPRSDLVGKGSDNSSELGVYEAAPRSARTG